MSATELVVYILWIEGVAALVVLAVILGYAVFSRRRFANREARLVTARALIARHLEDRTLSAEDFGVLRRLSPPDVIRLFFVVAPTVGLVERAWLREVADSLGLVDMACARTESDEWWNRLSGARFLTLVGAEPVAMERLAHDAHAAVRAASAMFLSQYPTPTAVETLIHMLDDDSAAARFAAKDALMRLGATATPAIATRLADADERHATVLLEIACAAPSHEYTASAAVLRGDASGSVRRLVARLFRGMGGEFATTQLTEMLRDADAAVREAAVEALGFLNHWSSSPLVAARLEDGSSRVRLAAALALDRFGAPGELFLRRAVARGSEVAQAAARRIIDDQSRSATHRVGTAARE